MVIHQFSLKRPSPPPLTQSCTGVFFPFTQTPEIAALAMAGSSALVATSGFILKRTKPGHPSVCWARQNRGGPNLHNNDLRGDST